MAEPLHVEPGAGDHAAQLCDAAAAELAGCAAQLVEDRFGDHHWLGACEEGRGWHQLLRAQTTSLHSLLTRHAENLSAFARRLRTTDADYHEADRDGAGRFLP